MVLIYNMVNGGKRMINATAQGDTQWRAGMIHNIMVGEYEVRWTMTLLNVCARRCKIHHSR